MKIRAYSPRTGNLLADDIIGINYGNIPQGQHCAIPVLIQPVKTDEDTWSSMSLLFQNDGGYDSSRFGYFILSDFISDPVLSDHFTGVGDSVSINDGDYAWLDVQVGAIETGSTSNINYRFVFEYS